MKVAVKVNNWLDDDVRQPGVGIDALPTPAAARDRRESGTSNRDRWESGMNSNNSRPPASGIDKASPEINKTGSGDIAGKSHEVALNPTECEDSLCYPKGNLITPEVNIQPLEVNIQSREVNIQPPVVNIQPLVINIQPLEVNIQSPEVNIQPPVVNIKPPSSSTVSARGKLILFLYIQ